MEHFTDAHLVRFSQLGCQNDQPDPLIVARLVVPGTEVAYLITWHDPVSGYSHGFIQGMDGGLVEPMAFSFPQMDRIFRASFGVGLLIDEAFEELPLSRLHERTAPPALPYCLHEVAITYRRPSYHSMPRILNSADADAIIRDQLYGIQIDLKEYFWVMLLNQANLVLGIACTGSGTIRGTAVGTHEIYQLALKANATAIIIAHNHPSGNLVPSDADKTLTRTIMDGGRLLDITILDHLIISSEGYFSFADENML